MIRLTEANKVCYVRPSADVTMKSVEQNHRYNVIGIIMTGMGNDGVEGIGHINSIDGITIAQDEKPSAIWGMPKAAIDKGYIDFVLPPEQIREILVLMLDLLPI